MKPTKCDYKPKWWFLYWLEEELQHVWCWCSPIIYFLEKIVDASFGEDEPGYLHFDCTGSTFVFNWRPSLWNDEENPYCWQIQYHTTGSRSNLSASFWPLLLLFIDRTYMMVNICQQHDHINESWNYNINQRTKMLEHTRTYWKPRKTYPIW